METNFFTGVEIAQIPKASSALIYRLVPRGGIPDLRFGPTVTVNQKDLIASSIRCQRVEFLGAKHPIRTKSGGWASYQMERHIKSRLQVRQTST